MSATMDQTRFENANKLWTAEHVEDAAHEFHAMAVLADYPDEKAALLANEHKCYCQISEFDKAQEVMRQIRELAVQDKFVRMIIDIGDACMMTLIGKAKEGVSLFERILQLNREELQSADSRHLYEEIQQRRGFALTSLERYAESIPVLKEATSFATTSSEDMQTVYFYLGIAYAGLSQTDLAKEAYLRAIGFALGNRTEADGRYRLAIIYFMKRAFAQAKYQLEAALQIPESVVGRELRKHIYQQVSRTCHYLGDSQEEQKYLRLAQSQ